MAQIAALLVLLLPNVAISSDKKNHDTNFVPTGKILSFTVPPKKEVSKSGVSVFNPDDLLSLSVTLSCVQEASVKNVQVSGSTKFFRFTVENVTKECPGFDIEATFINEPEIERPFQIAISTKEGQEPGQTISDPAVFVFNSVTGNWSEAQGGGNPSEPGKAFATLTESYNRVIAGIISYPDALGHNPTSLTPEGLISSIQSLDPTIGYQRIAPPTANSQGGTSIDFPLMLRPVRGPSPEIKIGYNSAAGIGLLGKGWDLTVPEINVETVSAPFSVSMETEDYRYQGHLLMPLHNGVFMAPNKRGGKLRNRVTSESNVQEYKLRDNSSGLIIRRHGGTPSTYYWEIYNPHSGQTQFFGSKEIEIENPENPEQTKKKRLTDNSAVERGTSSGNRTPISRWLLTEQYDNQPAQNQVRYKYLCSGHSKKCRAPDHVPVLEFVEYNNAKTPLEESKEINYPSWTDGLTKVSLIYSPRDPKRIISHGRFGSIVKQSRWLKSMKIEYGYDESGENGKVFSNYKFYLDDGRDRTLNFKHHLMRIELTANADLYNDKDSAETIREPTEQPSQYYSANLKKQVFAFEYHRSTQEQKWPDAKKLVDFDLCSEGITPPRVLNGLLGCSGMGEVTSPAGLGTSLSDEFGGSLHIGVGVDTDVMSKLKTIGVKAAANSSSSEGLTSLVDIDGDGLVDLVYKSNNSLKYCPGVREFSSIYNASVPAKFVSDETLGVSISKSCKKLIGIGNFSVSKSNTTSFSLEVHLEEGVLAGVGSSDTDNTTSTYFADVDGDGLLDIVNNMVVYYNLGKQGTTVAFKRNAPLIPPIPKNADASIINNHVKDVLGNQIKLISDKIEAIDKKIDTYPKLKPALHWRAPSSGIISLSGYFYLNNTNNATITILRDRTKDGVVKTVPCAVSGNIDDRAKVESFDLIDCTEKIVNSNEELQHRFNPLIAPALETNVDIFDAENKLSLRVEENDVIQFVLTNYSNAETSNSKMLPTIQSDIEIEYQAIDWDETFNALKATKPQFPFPEYTDLDFLSARSPYRVHSPVRDMNEASGNNSIARTPKDATNKIFKAKFQKSKSTQNLVLNLFLKSRTVKHESSFTLNDRCNTVDNNLVCNIELKNDDITGFQIEVQNAGRYAENKIIWKELPRIAFSYKDTAETSSNSQLTRISTKIKEIESQSPPQGSKDDLLLEKLREQRDSFATPTIELPVPVNDPLFAFRSQRVSHILDDGINYTENSDSKFPNVDIEIAAEQEAERRLCVSYEIILARTKKPRQVDNRCDDVGKYARDTDNDGYLDTYIEPGQPGQPDRSVGPILLSTKIADAANVEQWQIEVEKALQSGNSLFYDNSIVTETGFRLPVKTDPAECLGKTTCDYEYSLDLNPFPMALPLQMQLRVRLFVNGVLQEVEKLESSDRRIIKVSKPPPPKEQIWDPVFPKNSPEGTEYFVELKGADEMAQANLKLAQPTFKFSASPGDLIFVELTALSLEDHSTNETFALMAMNPVFAEAEILLNTNTGITGYESFMCEPGLANTFCDPKNRRLFQLQYPVLFKEGNFGSKEPIAKIDKIAKAVYGGKKTEPYKVTQSQLNQLKVETSSDKEALPAFTFNRGKWAISYHSGNNNESANSKQFPNVAVDGIDSNSSPEECKDSIEMGPNPTGAPVTTSFLPTDSECGEFANIKKIEEMITTAQSTIAAADLEQDDEKVEESKIKLLDLLAQLEIEEEKVLENVIASAPISSSTAWLPNETENYLATVLSVPHCKPLGDDKAKQTGVYWRHVIERPELESYLCSTTSAIADRLSMGLGRLGPDSALQRQKSELKTLAMEVQSAAEDVAIDCPNPCASDFRVTGRPMVTNGDLPVLLAPIQASTSTTNTKTLSVGPVSATLMGSDRVTTTNFLDINGDGFPETIPENGQGAMTSPVGITRDLWGKVFGDASGLEQLSSGFQQNGTAKSGTLGGGVAPPTAGQFLTRLVNTLTSGAVEGNFSLSLSADVGGGYNTENIEFGDFNGDGLVDPYTLQSKYTDAFKLKLNTSGIARSSGGFDSLITKPTVKNPIFDRFGTNSSAGFGLNLGYATNNNSFSGGVGTGFRTSGSYFTFMDFTADGRVDLVYPLSNGIVVVPNLGNGFDGELAKFHRIDGFDFNQSAATESVYTDLGGNITGGVTAFGIKVTATVGVKDTESYSRTLVQIRDFNADGLPDVAQEKSFYEGLNPLTNIPPPVDDYLTGLPKLGIGNGDINVHYNPEGRVGLLKSIMQPTGSELRLDYALIGNTGADHGRAVWSLARVEEEDSYKPEKVVFNGKDGKLPTNKNWLTADGHDLSSTLYRYGAGHFNRAEKAFYGFQYLLRDEFGADCNFTQKTSEEAKEASVGVCVITENQDGQDKAIHALEEPLRRTITSFNTKSYFGKGAISSEVILDPEPLLASTSNQLISSSKVGYDIYDYSANVNEEAQANALDLWKTASSVGPLFSRTNAVSKPENSLLDLFDEHFPTSLRVESIEKVSACHFDENSISLEQHEYSHPFETYIGARRERLSVLDIFGESAFVKTTIGNSGLRDGQSPIPLTHDTLDCTVEGNSIEFKHKFVRSAIGYDPDQWGQPKAFYDIGRAIPKTVEEKLLAVHPETKHSLRADINYANLDASHSQNRIDLPRPLLGRAASIRITQGLEAREIEQAQDDFIRGRQATYQPVTGNVEEICLFSRDVRDTLCLEYVEALDQSTSSSADTRVQTALESVVIEPENLIHSRIIHYDEFGNPEQTLSPLNNNGEWISKLFDYRGDPFRLNPSEISLTRCIKDQQIGQSTPTSISGAGCGYGKSSVDENIKPVIHRSLQGIDTHFGTVSVSTDINNNSLLTEVDPWGRPILVARNFGGSNTGSGFLDTPMSLAATRHRVAKGVFWAPVLSVEYLGPEKWQQLPVHQINKVASDSTTSPISQYPPSNNRALFRTRVAKYVSGEFYRGLQSKAHTLGAVHSLNLVDSDGKNIQNITESEVCTKAGIDLDQYSGRQKILDEINYFQIQNLANPDKKAQNFFRDPTETVNAPVLSPEDRANLAKEDAYYSNLVRNNALCSEFHSLIVQPGTAVDALGRELSKYEPYPGPIQEDEVNAHLYPPTSKDRKYKLEIFTPELSPLKLLPVESTIYDAADRPLISINRLGRLALQRDTEKTIEIGDTLNGIATHLMKRNISASNRFLEATQLSYRIEDGLLDGGPLFTTTTVSPRCAVSRSSFDARGLVLRVSQQHDDVVDDKSKIAKVMGTYRLHNSRQTNADISLATMATRGFDSELPDFISKIGVSRPGVIDRVNYERKTRLHTDSQIELDDVVKGLNNLSSSLLSRQGAAYGYDTTHCKSISQIKDWPEGISSKASQSVAYRYDALRQLTSVALPKAGTITSSGKSEESLGSIEIDYDKFGRRIALDDVNTGVSEYSYDDFNNVVSERSSRKASGIQTEKIYAYSADRLVQIDYKAGTEQRTTTGSTFEEDQADTVKFYYDDHPTTDDLLTDTEAKKWFDATINEASCENCIGRISLVKDRSGLKAMRYTPLGQESEHIRSIIHPESRLNGKMPSDVEIGRFRQKNTYTAFGDLVDTSLEDIRPSKPSPKCITNGQYICSGTVNLGYRHTPDGKISTVLFAQGNQPIMSTAYDSLSRPYLQRTGDLTHKHLHFDPIDLRLNRIHTRTAVNSVVQNVQYSYQPGGNVASYTNSVPQFKLVDETSARVGFQAHNSEFKYFYDTPNRLIGMSATINNVDSKSSYWYDDAHRFTWRTFDRGSIGPSGGEPGRANFRSWIYTYPTGDNVRPRHAPQTVVLSTDILSADSQPDITAELGLTTTTEFDALGRLVSIKNRQLKNADPENLPLTQRRLIWDAEDRLRRAVVRLPVKKSNSTDLTESKLLAGKTKNESEFEADADPTGAAAQRVANAHPDCAKDGEQGSATRAKCRVEDMYTYDFGSNRVVKRTWWPTEDSVDEEITLYVTPFYSRGYNNRGTIQISSDGQAQASIDMPYTSNASLPGVTYLFSDLAVGSLTASIRTVGEPGIDLPVVSRREYSPYGLSLTSNDLAKLEKDKENAESNGQRNLHSFLGKEFDSSTGFSVFGARYYSRDLGIWLTADPVLKQQNNYISSSPADIASFSFTNLNPILYSDNDGQRARPNRNVRNFRNSRKSAKVLRTVRKSIHRQNQRLNSRAARKFKPPPTTNVRNLNPEAVHESKLMENMSDLLGEVQNLTEDLKSATLPKIPNSGGGNLVEYTGENKNGQANVLGANVYGDGSGIRGGVKDYFSGDRIKAGSLSAFRMSTNSGTRPLTIQESSYLQRAQNAGRYRPMDGLDACYPE